MFSSFYLEKGLMEDYSSRKDPNGLRNVSRFRKERIWEE
jgi:hypothetical protein